MVNAAGILLVCVVTQGRGLKRLLSVSTDNGYRNSAIRGNNR
jgi:hypothetical protein